MNCCGRLYRFNVRWLRRCLQTTSFHNGQSSSRSLKMYDRSYLVNKIYSSLISRQFGTSHLFNASRNEELQKNCLNIFRKLSADDLVAKGLVAKLENFEYFQSLLSKLEQLGHLVNYSWPMATAKGLKLSEQQLDHYLNKLSELQDAGFSADCFDIVFKPFKNKEQISGLPDIDETVRQIETLQVKYGLRADQIEILATEGLEELIEKMEILKSGGFPDHLDYKYYRILFDLSTPVLRDFFNDLQESGHSKYGVSDLKKHLEEKNYGIENIELLSELTGVTVPEIRRLTKHFNHRYIPISSQDLEAKIDVMMKTHGLSREVVCQVCCFLTYPLNQLIHFLDQYTTLKDKGDFPWDLKVFLSNPCVQKLYMDMDTGYLHMLNSQLALFKSKLELSNKCCQDTLICLLLEKRKSVFDTMLVNIEMLNSHFPMEEIITPKSMDKLKKKKKNVLKKGLKRAENLQGFSISHLEKFIFRQRDQHLIVKKMLGLPKDYKKVEKMIQIEAQDVEANIKLLENYGFLRRDIQKLFIVVYADNEKLKHQLDVLSSRPEILESNLQVTSFKALNYVQYFLEFEHKDDDFDQSNICKMDDENDDDDECNNDESDFHSRGRNDTFGY